MAPVTHQEIEATLWDTAMNMAHRYVSAYREILLTDFQIVAAMTSDARSGGFSAEDSAEIAELAFKTARTKPSSSESVSEYGV